MTINYWLSLILITQCSINPKSLTVNIPNIKHLYLSWFLRQSASVYYCSCTGGHYVSDPRTTHGAQRYAKCGVVWCGVRTVEWCNVESVVQLSQLSPHSPNTTAQLLGKGDLTLVSQPWDVLPTHHNIHNLVDTTTDVSQLSIYKARLSLLTRLSQLQMWSH